MTNPRFHVYPSLATMQDNAKQWAESNKRSYRQRLQFRIVAVQYQRNAIQWPVSKRV